MLLFLFLFGGGDGEIIRTPVGGVNEKDFGVPTFFFFFVLMCVCARNPISCYRKHARSLARIHSRIHARSVGESMGGTMGGVLQIFFSAGDACLSSPSSPSPSPAEGQQEGGRAWCRAFVAGVEGVEFYGGAKAGMRTVLDAVVPAAEVLRQKGPSGIKRIFHFAVQYLRLEWGGGGGLSEAGRYGRCKS